MFVIILQCEFNALYNGNVQLAHHLKLVFTCVCNLSTPACAEMSTFDLYHKIFTLPL